MTDDEANSFFDELMDALRHNHLHWIAEQVSREIAEGRPTVTGLKSARPRKNPAERVIQVAEYEPKEKLLTLITVIEETVVSSAMIVQHFADFLSVAPGQPLSITFTGDAPDDTATTISETHLTTTVPAGVELRRLLSELRSEVDVVLPDASGGVIDAGKT